MALAQPVDIVVNPSNVNQYYVLWGNGRIDAYGGAPPITSSEAQFFDRTDQPVAVALYIANWSTGAGQVLDMQGGFQPINGGTQYMDTSGSWPVNTLGIVFDNKRRYVWWYWDPAGTASGYVLDGYGQWFPFGGATVPPRGGPRFSTFTVRGGAMLWSGGVKKAYMVDAYGAVWSDFSAPTPPIAAPYYKGQDVIRDLAITDWTVGKGYTLTGDGGVHPFGGATASGVAGPFRAGRDVARLLYVMSATDPVQFRQVHSGGEVFEYFNSTPPTVTAAGGQSEQQTVTITGSPTGGTFTLTYSGQTTAAIARNAAASTVQSSLQALSNIGSGNVTASGGPLPAAVTVTFTGALAKQDLPAMTATSSLTGGTSPAVVIALATPGIASSPALTVTDVTRPVLSWTYSDPERDSQAAWQLYVYTAAWVSGHSMTDPSVWAANAVVAQSGNNPSTRGIESPVDLANGTYVMYVRAQDTAGNWSPWSSFAWTQIITPPTAPTGLTATANLSTYSVALSATTGGTAPFVKFEYSDDGGTTWNLVRGAEQVTRSATTTATDWDIPMGATRSYRATAYSVAPRTASVASSTASATMSAQVYTLTSTANSALGGRFYVQDPVGWTRTAKAGVWETIGDEFPTIVSDGLPKGRKGSLHLVSLDAATWAKIIALLESDSTLVLRTPHGDVIYCRLVGDWSYQLLKGAAAAQDRTTELPLIEVAPPTVSV